MMRRLIHEALIHSTGRRQYGRSISESQLVQQHLADCQADHDAASARLAQAVRATGSGREMSRIAATAKLFASEAVDRVADRVLQIWGGSGSMRDSAPARFLADARLMRIYEGTSEIMRLTIAREMLTGAGTGSL